MKKRAPWVRMFAAATALVSMSTATRSLADDFKLIAVQIGNGSAIPGDQAQPVSLNEYGNVTSASSSFLSTHALPSAGPTALTLSGAGSHDGHLNASSNGQYLLLGGYRADAGAANPIPQSASAVNRVIGRINLDNWSIDTSTGLTDAYDGGEMDAVVSDNGQRFWVAGDGTNNGADSTAGGLRYVNQLGASTTINIGQTQSIPSPSGLSPDSMRNARLVNGQLYITTASQGSFGNRGLYQTTDPLPTTGPQTMIPVMNNNEGNSSSSAQEMTADSKGKWVPKSDLVFADLNSSIPGADTAYSTGGKNEFEKWSLLSDGAGGFTWKQVQVSTILNGGGDGLDVNALDLIVNPDHSVDLFVANDAGVYRFVDTTGYISTQPAPAAGFLNINDPTYFITAPADTKFRGIAIVAVPEPAFAPLALAGFALLVRRRSARKE